MKRVRQARLRAVRLKSALDIQVGLARVFNEVRRGELKEGTARTLIYCLSVMVRTIEMVGLDARLDELEAQVKEFVRKRGPGA